MNHKKNPVLNAILGLFALICGFFAANIGATAAIMKRYSYKLRLHKEENNKMDSYFLQNETVEIHPVINNVYISLLFSKIDVKIPKPDNDQMNVEITSFAGKLNIDLPAGVTVICKGRGDLDFTKEGSETCPVINITINDLATSLTIGFDGDSNESSSNQS